MEFNLTLQMRRQLRRPPVERSRCSPIRRTKSRDFIRILRVDQMIEPTVLQLRSIWRTRHQSAIRQNIPRVHCVDCRLILAAEVLSVISRDLFSSETHIVDPSLVWREKNEIRRERNSRAWRETLNDTAEIVNEKLFPQPGNCPIVLAGGMQHVGVIAGSTESAENCIDTRPAASEMPDINVDDRVGFRVQRIVHID